ARGVADRHRDRLAGVRASPAPHAALVRVHGDGAHRRLAEMLGDLKYQAMALILRLERVEDGRQMPFEVHVDDCADHLRDVPDWICHGWSLLLRRYRRLRVHTASAPEMISISSFVIIAWRVRFEVSVCLRILSRAFRVALSFAGIRGPSHDG